LCRKCSVGSVDMGMRALNERNEMLAPGDFIVNKCALL
jgi:hypothetical protein